MSEPEVEKKEYTVVLDETQIRLLGGLCRGALPRHSPGDGAYEEILSVMGVLAPLESRVIYANAEVKHDTAEAAKPEGINATVDAA
jgi:hypothetical protein